MSYKVVDVGVASVNTVVSVFVPSVAVTVYIPIIPSSRYVVVKHPSSPEATSQLLTVASGLVTLTVTMALARNPDPKTVTVSSGE